MARVSVIIPTYNRAHIVGEAIDSVLAQTHRDFEVIVVDDASADGTRDALARYGDRIRVIPRKANGGAGAARNDGIRASSGEFIAFLDADDLYHPGRLESAVRFLEKHPEYGAAYGEVLHVDPAGKQPPSLWVRKMGGPCSGWIFDQVLQRNVISTQTITIRRAILDRVGLFNEALPSGQDWDLWWRIARVTQIGYIERVLCTYRMTSDGLSRGGVKAAASWIQRDQNALATYQGLTPRQRKLLQLRLYTDQRYYAFYLAREGRYGEEKRACLEAVRTAALARLWLPALKALAALLIGQRTAEWAQALRARRAGASSRPGRPYDAIP